MRRLKLAIITLAFTALSAVSSLAADANFTYGKVVGLEKFESLDETTRNNFLKNTANLPNSMLDLHKRTGGTVFFVDALIPDYNDNAVKATFGNDVMGVHYTGGKHHNDIYVRIDDSLAQNSKYNHYHRTISHEFGHFAYFTTLDEWTPEMKNTLRNEYEIAKNSDSKCYNENETFAHEYSKYIESDSLVSPEMAGLFKEVERRIAEKDRAITHARNIDDERQENIVTFELNETEKQMANMLDEYKDLIAMLSANSQNG